MWQRNFRFNKNLSALRIQAKKQIRQQEVDNPVIIIGIVVIIALIVTAVALTGKKEAAKMIRNRQFHPLFRKQLQTIAFH